VYDPESIIMSFPNAFLREALEWGLLVEGREEPVGSLGPPAAPFPKGSPALLQCRNVQGPDRAQRYSREERKEVLPRSSRPRPRAERRRGPPGPGASNRPPRVAGHGGHLKPSATVGAGPAWRARARPYYRSGCANGTGVIMHTGHGPGSWLPPGEGRPRPAGGARPRTRQRLEDRSRDRPAGGSVCDEGGGAGRGGCWRELTGRLLCEGNASHASQPQTAARAPFSSPAPPFGARRGEKGGGAVFARASRLVSRSGRLLPQPRL